MLAASPVAVGGPRAAGPAVTGKRLGGALNMFRAVPGEFDSADVRVGQALAGVATISLLHSAACVTATLSTSSGRRLLAAVLMDGLARICMVTPELGGLRPPLQPHGRDVN
jgi:hypothetical protein